MARPASDPVLLEAARRQLALVFEAMDGAAMLGWWRAWLAEPGVSRDDLCDLLSEAQARWLIGQGSGEG